MLLMAVVNTGCITVHNINLKCKEIRSKYELVKVQTWSLLVSHSHQVPSITSLLVGSRNHKARGWSSLSDGKDIRPIKTSAAYLQTFASRISGERKLKRMASSNSPQRRQWNTLWWSWKHSLQRLPLLCVTSWVPSCQYHNYCHCQL